MGNSIQEYCKKINSRLDYTDILSLFLTFTCLLSLFLYLDYVKSKTRVPFLYKEGVTEEEVQPSVIFASRNGKTYTYSWCKGAQTILEKNKIYFKTEEEAKQSGRVLSKMCH